MREWKIHQLFHWTLFCVLFTAGFNLFSEDQWRLNLSLGPQVILVYGETFDPGIGGSLVGLSLEYLPEGSLNLQNLSAEFGLEYHLYTLGSRLDIIGILSCILPITNESELKIGLSLSPGLSFHRPTPLLHFSTGPMVSFGWEWLPGHRIFLTQRLIWLTSPGYQAYVPGWQEGQYQFLLGYSWEL